MPVQDNEIKSGIFPGERIIVEHGKQSCQKFKEKVFCHGNLCYHGVDERIPLQGQKFGGFSPGQEAPKTILDRGTQGCRIISAYGDTQHVNSELKGK